MRSDIAVRNAYYYHKRQALSAGEPFDVTIRQWLDCWHSSPLGDQQSHIARMWDDLPWSQHNMERRPGFAVRGIHVVPADRSVRNLTVRQWVSELRAGR